MSNIIFYNHYIKQDRFWTGFMKAAYHQYLILAIPGDHPHLFQTILSNVLKTKVGKYEKVCQKLRSMP